MLLWHGHHGVVTMDVVAAAVLVGFALTVCLTDIRFRRIPNWLTIGGASLGVVFTSLAGGSLMLSAGGLGVGVAVGFVLSRFRMLGAGDAKFMAAIGAWAGWDRLPVAYLAMLAGGALFALAWSARHRMLRATLISTSTMVGSALSSGERIAPVMGATAAGKFPYGVGLAVGAVAWWFWAGGTLP